MNPILENISPFMVMEVLEAAQKLESQGHHFIHMEVGEPDFATPQCIIDAAKQAYDKGYTHYTHSLGDYGLRTEIAHLYKREYDVDVDPDCVLVTSGSSPAILLALMVLCEAGSEAIVPDPGYACYGNFVRTCNAMPVSLTLNAEDGFLYDIERIKKHINPKTRALFINSPMNPTGTMLDDEQMNNIAQLGIPIISDEIYHGLVYEGKAQTMLRFTENCFVINGFSKRFAMTGMRLGYMIAPSGYMRALQILQQNLFICAPGNAQQAGIAALTMSDKDVSKMRNMYNERRKYMLTRLRKMGFIIHAEPTGAFYVFADARQFTSDSYTFAFDVLNRAHVGITPGIDFGKNGEGFVRFSYANSLENIKEGLDRLDDYLTKNYGFC